MCAGAGAKKVSQGGSAISALLPANRELHFRRTTKIRLPLVLVELLQPVGPSLAPSFGATQCSG